MAPKLLIKHAASVRRAHSSPPLAENVCQHCLEMLSAFFLSWSKTDEKCSRSLKRL